MAEAKNYIEIFIAAGIIVVFLNFFLFLIIKRTVQKIKEQTKGYFVDKLGVYDELVAEKEATLEDLNKKITALAGEIVDEEKSIAENETSADANFEIRNPGFKNEDLLGQYKKINDRFNFDETEIIQYFIETKYQPGKHEGYDALVKLREKFSFGLIYELTTLSKTAQTAFVLKHFTDFELYFIKHYLSSNDGFDCLDFVRYLEQFLKNNDPYIYVRSNVKNNDYKDLNKMIVPVYDPFITMGIQIIYRNQLYDYAL